MGGNALASAVLTAPQLAPGGALDFLPWPAEGFYAVVGVAGAIAGLLGGQRRIVAIMCGAVAGIGSLLLLPRRVKK